jgi:hypothetical protein
MVERFFAGGPARKLKNVYCGEQMVKPTEKNSFNPPRAG